MEQIMHSFLLLLVLAVAGVQSYATGAPTSVCDSMFPGHRVNAQTSTPSYSISASSTSYTPGQEVTVTLNSANNPFSGVMIQARSNSSSKQVGKFRLDPSEAALQLITCTQAQDTITHKDTNAKTTKTFYWVAPASSAGPVYFRATVAQSQYVFWTAVKSGVVQDASQTAGSPVTTVPSQPTSTVAGAGSPVTTVPYRPPSTVAGAGSPVTTVPYRPPSTVAGAASSGGNTEVELDDDHDDDTGANNGNTATSTSNGNTSSSANNGNTASITGDGNAASLVQTSYFLMTSLAVAVLVHVL